MSALGNLLRIGTREEYSHELNLSIEISNAAAIIFVVLIGIPFNVISFIYFPSILWIPAVGILGFLVTFPLNAANQPLIARIVLSLVPILLASGYVGATNTVGEEVPPVALLVVGAFCAIPLAIFDWKTERLIMTAMFLVGASQVVLYAEINALIEIEVEGNSSIFIDGPLRYLTGALGMLSFFLVLYAFSYRSVQAEEKTGEVLAELRENNERMQGNEKELKDSLTQLTKAQEEERNRQWYTEGMAKVNEFLRSKREAEEVYNDILSFLIEYLDANQGGVFVANDQGTQDPMDNLLVLKASYAYNKKKYISKEVVAGQSFLGQPYLEGKSYMISEVPDGYIEITSGLGEATPSFLAMVPIMEDESVEGVIELAKFEPFTDVQMHFFEGVCKTISSFVINQHRQEESDRLIQKSLVQEEKFRQREEEREARELDYIEQIRDLKDEIDRLNSKISIDA